MNEIPSGAYHVTAQTEGDFYMENLQSDHLDTQNLYRDMQKRTGGEIYIGW